MKITLFGLRKESPDSATKREIQQIEFPVEAEVKSVSSEIINPSPIEGVILADKFFSAAWFTTDNDELNDRITDYYK